MTDLSTLISKLEAWTEESADFHADRQLSDEVLLADGWEVEQNDAFEGGIAWKWGSNPTYYTTEANRPHLINDLNTAIGVVPHGCGWHIDWDGRTAHAAVWSLNSCVGQSGLSERPAVAILIAALKFMQAQQKGREG